MVYNVAVNFFQARFVRDILVNGFTPKTLWYNAGPEDKCQYFIHIHTIH